MKVSHLTASLVMLAGATFSAHAQTTLTVYSALEADQMRAYQAAFEKQNPDIKIQWVRDSTGIITAKLLAEKNNPQADVIWGVAGTSMGLFQKEGMLHPYAPANLARIDSKMRDSANPPSWVGMDGYAATLCVNTIELEKNKLPMPTSWEDLTNPVYEGKIVMPNPASSGTGFLDVSSWLQLFGWDKGWAYMDALHRNIGAYTHSGSKPCNLAAAGEYVIGVSFDYRAVKLMADGAPIKPAFPKEGLGWEIEAAAIVKGTRKLDAAQKLADFSASDEANELYRKNFAVLAIPSLEEPLPGLPKDFSSMLINNDFEWAAVNREKILAEWAKRYDGKSEPRN